jgi:hypothetical protein
MRNGRASVLQDSAVSANITSRKPNGISAVALLILDRVVGPVLNGKSRKGIQRCRWMPFEL